MNVDSMFELLQKYNFLSNNNPDALENLARELAQLSSVAPPPYIGDVHHLLLLAVVKKATYVLAGAYANGMRDGYLNGFQQGMATAPELPGVSSGTSIAEGTS